MPIGECDGHHWKPVAPLLYRQAINISEIKYYCADCYILGNLIVEDLCDSYEYWFEIVQQQSYKNCNKTYKFKRLLA